MDAPEKSSPEVTTIDELLRKSEGDFKPSKPVPLKRPRGRPRKDAQAPAQAAPADPLAPPAPPAPEVDLKPILGAAVAMPFAIAAGRTGCQELNLTDDEGMTLAAQVDAVLKIYCPQIGTGPASAAMVLAASVGMLAFSKYAIFLQWQSTQKPADPKPEKTEAPSAPAAPAEHFPIHSV